MPLAEAKKHVKSIRSCINPNDGFMGQLSSYEGILTARYILYEEHTQLVCEPLYEQKQQYAG